MCLCLHLSSVLFISLGVTMDTKWLSDSIPDTVGTASGRPSEGQVPPETLRLGGDWRPTLALTTFWFPGPELHHSPLLPPSPAEFLSSFHWGHSSEHVSTGGTESGEEWPKNPIPKWGSSETASNKSGGTSWKKGISKGWVTDECDFSGEERHSNKTWVRRQPRGSQASWQATCSSLGSIWF